MTKSVFVFDTETTSAKVQADYTQPGQALAMQFYGSIYEPPADLNEWFQQEGDQLVILEAMAPVIAMNVLISIPDDITPEPEAVAVHGITKEKAQRFGIGEDNAAHLINDLLDIADIAVAHNIDFDRRVINHMLYRQPDIMFPDMKIDEGAFSGIEQYCTMKELTKICRIPKKGGGLKWPTLLEAYRFFFGRDFDGKAHDASADTIACAEIYFAHKYFEQLGVLGK